MRNTSPVGWRVTRYDYINRQLYNGADGLGYLNANPPDLWLSADRGLATVGARELSGNNFFQSSSYDVPFSTNSFTVDLWAKINVFQKQTFFFGSGGGSSGEPGFVFIHSSNNQAGFLISDNSSVHSIYSNASTVNEWKHYVAVIDRVNNVANLYINSSLVSSTSIAGMGSISSTQAGIAIGNIRYAGSTTYSFVGVLSKVKLYLGYAYNQADVDESYALGNGLFAAELSSNLFVRLSHAWNLNEASGRALDCLSTWHLTETGSSTTISSTDGPRESIVADNSGNDYHLKLVNYSASQKVTHWVTDSDGSEGLKFERASSHYCEGITNHAFSDSTLGFIQGSIGVRFKWQGSTVNTYEGLVSFGSQQVSIVVNGPTKRIRAYLFTNVAGSTAVYSYSNTNSIIADSTSWQTALVTFDGLSTDVRFPKVYIDGNEQTTGTLNHTTYFQPSDLTLQKFYIGTGLGLTNYPTAIIDRVQIWNVVLSSSDAVAFHNGSTPATAPVMDYRFNDGPQESRVSNGDSIAGWKSREGRNYEFNQGTLANRPTWVANAEKGNPAIRFDGTNDYLSCLNTILSSTKGVVFIVGRNDLITGRPFLTIDNASTGYPYLQFINYYTSTVDAITISNLTGLSSDRAGYGITMTSQFASTKLAVFMFSKGLQSTSGLFGVNGHTSLGNWLGPAFNRWVGELSTDTTTINNVTIGGISKFCGRISEIIAYDGSKTPSYNNTLAIERYLLTKYGIST